MSDMRLLVVDDEPKFGEFVREVAKNWGYEVTVTTSGNDFKRAYEEFDPTVILLDLVMPEPEGIQLLHWLAERHATAEIIIATGYNPSYAFVAKKLGENKGLRLATILTKPVPIAKLRSALHR